jgi:hypothetical protein
MRRSTRRFSQTTPAEELALGEVIEAGLLAAMDCPLARQHRVEQTLARRHLADARTSSTAGRSRRGIVWVEPAISRSRRRATCRLRARGLTVEGARI